jgi:hypothetical protein
MVQRALNNDRSLAKRGNQNRNRWTDNAMIYKTLQRKLKIEQRPLVAIPITRTHCSDSEQASLCSI